MFIISRVTTLHFDLHFGSKSLDLIDTSGNTLRTRMIERVRESTL